MDPARDWLALWGPAVGLLGQSLFAVRAAVQWLASERAGRSLVPPSYWWLAAAGAALLGIYAATTRDAILLAAPLVTLLVALRNLALQRRRLETRPAPLALRAPLGVLLLAGAGIAVAASLSGSGRPPPGAAWLAIGAAGTALWVARQPLQWWISERAGRSELPRIYWWTSFLGALLLCAYAAARRDPVFVLAYAFSPLPCARNLLLIRRGRHRAGRDAPIASGPLRAGA